MRIKVNPKEKSLTGDKMERGGAVGRKSYEKGAQLCTLYYDSYISLFAACL